MKKSGMTAKTLRGILSVVIVILIGLSAVGFYYAQNWLLGLATSISQTVAQSNSSGTSMQSLSQLQADLTAHQDVILKVNALVAPLQTYQSQSINDLNQYATASGITISNYSFDKPTTTTTAGTAAPVVASAANSSYITATIASPTSFSGVLKFMHLVEGNLPKMQISSVNMGRASSGGGDSVKIDQLSIQVYTR